MEQSLIWYFFVTHRDFDGAKTGHPSVKICPMSSGGSAVRGNTLLSRMFNPTVSSFREI